MQRRLVKSALGLTLGGAIAWWKPETLLVVSVALAIYLLWTWDGLQPIVARFNKDDDTLSLGDIWPVIVGRTRRVQPPAPTEESPQDRQFRQEMPLTLLLKTADTLFVVAKNETAKTILSAKILVKEIAPWKKKYGTTVVSAETHTGPDDTFVPFYVDPFEGHAGKILPDSQVLYGLTGNSFGKLVIHGDRPDAPERSEVLLTPPGIWQAIVDVSAEVLDEAKVRTEVLSFDWNGNRVKVLRWPVVGYFDF